MATSGKKKGRMVYHITPDALGKCWIVTQENRNMRQEFDTKEEAEKFARHRARLNQFAQVKVHKKDGDLDYESTYGEDPRDLP